MAIDPAIDMPEIPKEIPEWARAPIEMLSRVLKARVHRKVRKDHQSNLEALEKALASLTETRRKLEKASLKKGVIIFNAAQFAMLIQYDVSALAHDVLLTPPGFRRNLYCRHLAVTLIEAVEDLSGMLGWKFRQSIKSVFNDDAVDQRIQFLTKDLGHFISKHNRILREIRVAVAAHRDQNASTQLRVMEALNCGEFLGITSEFVEVNRKVLAVLRHLITMSTAKAPFIYFKMLEEGPTS